ncbi:MAG TPA: branched-chain amino acid ABC transporter permease [Dehalococcoidales bacterium]|nr:branched-chain amino acid ABC transporter permease [Dehalococcoidales bacterium]
MGIVRVISKRPFALGLLCLILVLLATLPLYAAEYTVILLTAILMYIAITVSWTIFSGPTRYISLASAAFFGVGIYTSAILGKAFPLLAVIGIGGFISVILALFIGLLTLRLRGMYFIIFTFGISELMKNSLLWWETNRTGTVGRWVVAVDHTIVYYIMLAIFAGALLTAYLVRHSKLGLALQSIGDNEEAAAHAGINVTLVKVITFAISAFFMGAAGAIMATRWAYIDPRIAFNPLFSFMPVLMAIFGGMGQLYGPILGAAIFTYLEEILITKFAYYYMLLFGIVLVIAILYLPNGLAGLIQKWRKGGVAKQRTDT